jgi:hypothetical protein
MHFNLRSWWLKIANGSMISEVVNALFLTYVASEYLVAEDLPSRRAGRRRMIPRSTLVMVLIAGLVNILDRVTGAQDMANNLFQGFLHLPRVCFVAVMYIVALYIDVTRRAPQSPCKFLFKVGWQFLKVLPVYPFLAILISFVFLFVINLWEALDLPMEWLNAPIYYGTLYGPFGFVYVRVKRSILNEHSSLPA